MVFPPAKPLLSVPSPEEALDAAGRAPQAPGGALGDAESGNTASHDCIRGQGKADIQVLWKGWDTLELSYQGEISKESDAELKRLKALAQAAEIRNQAQAQLKLGERVFEVTDRGGSRMHAYTLRHPDMRITLASIKAKRVPLACVTFQNQFLITVGPIQAEAEARAIVASLGELHGAETVSRCDQAVDIGTNQDIGAWSEDAWVTRAKNLHRHTQEGKFTGWSIGLGAALSSRLYDKLLEIESKSHKTYFFELWLAAGWFLGDPVKRLEHQLRRSVLAQFGLTTVADVLAASPALWAYATRAWTWLAIPNPGDETKARWPIHPFWEQVQAIEWQGNVTTLERRRPSTNAPSDKMLARMFKAPLTSIMARDGLDSVEAAAASLIGLLWGQLQHVEQWEGAAADEMLREAVMLKRRKYCTGFNGK